VKTLPSFKHTGVLSEPYFCLKTNWRSLPKDTEAMNTSLQLFLKESLSLNKGSLSLCQIKLSFDLTYLLQLQQLKLPAGLLSAISRFRAISLIHSGKMEGGHDLLPYLYEQQQLSATNQQEDLVINPFIDLTSFHGRETKLLECLDKLKSKELPLLINSA